MSALLDSRLDIARRAECVCGDEADRVADEVMFGLRPHALSPLERELADALRLVLPLAKGYAAAHPVGSNAAYVDEADAVLAKIGGAA